MSFLPFGANDRVKDIPSRIVPEKVVGENGNSEGPEDNRLTFSELKLTSRMITDPIGWSRVVDRQCFPVQVFTS